MQPGLVLFAIGTIALISILFLITLLLFSRAEDPDSRSPQPEWTRLKEALNLREEEEDSLALVGRWDSYPLLVQYLPGKGQTNPKLLFILETKLDKLPPAALPPEGGNDELEVEAEQAGLKELLDREGIRRPLRYLVEEKGLRLLLREEGLALEMSIGPRFLNEPPVSSIQDQLEMLSILAQELGSVNSTLASKPPTYPFQT